MKKIITVIIAISMIAALFVGCAQKAVETPAETPATTEEAVTPAPAPEKLKVAILLPGAANDKGWNAVAVNGIKGLEKDLGAEISIAETVPASDYEERFRGYANEGYKVIFAHGFEFQDAANKVAKEFPNTYFIITSSDKFQDPNVAGFETNVDQAGYIAGMIAGLNTKTNKVFGIGAMDIPSIKGELEAYARGAKAANPKVTAEIAYTGSFEDGAKAKEMANAFYESGFDVGTFNADASGLGVLESAKSHDGAMIAGSVNNYNDEDPNIVVGSVSYSFDGSFKYIVEQIINGTFKPQAFLLGLNEGGVTFHPSANVANPETNAIIEKAIADIKAGTLDPTK
ncbi:MAG: BMP family protein [Clostridia bacterium]